MGYGKGDHNDPKPSFVDDHGVAGTIGLIFPISIVVGVMYILFQ